MRKSLKTLAAKGSKVSRSFLLNSSGRFFQIAFGSHREVQAIIQLEPLSEGVALNLAEGSAKPSPKDRARFCRIALGSFRESVAVLQLLEIHNPELSEITDKLAHHLCKLCKTLE